MDLLSIVITLIVIGVLLWLVETYIPMSPSIKNIIRVIVIIVVVIWLLQQLGVLGSLRNIKIVL
jgi:hypothetical protein